MFRLAIPVDDWPYYVVVHLIVIGVSSGPSSVYVRRTDDNWISGPSYMQVRPTSLAGGNRPS